MAAGGRWEIVETSYPCGDYMDAAWYQRFNQFVKEPGRRKRYRTTKAMQEALNQRNAEKSITRLAHLNFTPEDIALHTTYAVNPDSYEAVKKDVKNFLGRVRYQIRKNSLPALKYIYCIERSGSGRWHVHMIMGGGIGRDEAERLWHHGYANADRLRFNERGIRDLAHYMTKKQKGEGMTRRRWTPSKNLKKPVPVTRRRSAEDIRAAMDAIDGGDWQSLFEGKHEGWKLSEKPEYYTSLFSRCGYVTFEMHRPPQTKQKENERSFRSRPERPPRRKPIKENAPG